MIPGAFDGGVSLGNGHENHTEWIEVQQECDFNDSISEVIGSSMGLDAPDNNNVDGDGDGGETSSAQNRSVNEDRDIGHHLKERQRARTRAEDEHVEDEQVKKRRLEERSEAKGDQTEEQHTQGCQLNGHQGSKEEAIDSMPSQVPQSGTDSHSVVHHARKTFPSSVPKLGQPNRETTYRKIIELNRECDQLLSQNRAYEEEIAKLNEQLKKNDRQIVCATCSKCLNEPYFCSKECHMEFN